MVEESFADIWANSLISEEDEEAGAQPEVESDQADNERELLQKVYDKYGEKLGGVTVDDMVSELLSLKPTVRTKEDVSDTSLTSQAKSVQTDIDSQTIFVENLRSGFYLTNRFYEQRDTSTYF